MLELINVRRTFISDSRVLGLPIVTSTIEKPRLRTQILRLLEAEGGKNEKFRGYPRVREQVIY